MEFAKWGYFVMKCMCCRHAIHMDIRSQTELVAQLRAQHIALMQGFERALTHSRDLTETNVPRVLEALTQFTHKLHEHFTLENEIFYPLFLEKKHARGENTESIEKFIAEVQSTESTITAFLDSFETQEQIVAQAEKFRSELQSIFLQFCKRIETENDIIYDVFLLM